MNNPTDKNGNTLNIGDRIVYMKGTPKEDYGVITKFDVPSYGGTMRVYSHWSGDENHPESYCDAHDVELIESPVSSDNFTKEDEAMLQMLIAKKEKADKLRDAAEESFQRIIDELYETSTDFVLTDFVMNNIDEICNVLQNYKRTVQTN